MKRYTVVAIERFRVRTKYRDVAADSPEQAEQLCRDGECAYDGKEILEGDEEWLETESIEEEPAGNTRSILSRQSSSTRLARTAAAKT